MSYPDFTDMGTIIERKRKDGSLAFMAQVIKKSDNRIIARKAATFPSRRAAEQWIKKTERLVENPETFIDQRQKRATVADAIRECERLRKNGLGKKPDADQKHDLEDAYCFPSDRVD